MVAVIWSLAVVGVAVKLFVIRAPRWLTAGVYLFMGWLSVIAARRSLPRSRRLRWSGCCSAGCSFYRRRSHLHPQEAEPVAGRLPGFHEVWHVFVILGAFSYFVMIAGWGRTGRLTAR